MTLLALWSPPRCRSTAFLRMMAERGDHQVVHEPFSHVTNFGEATVGDVVAHSQHAVIDALQQLSAAGPVFFKDTTDFAYPQVLADTRFLRSVTHTFLVREPAAAIRSHARLNPAVTSPEIGFTRLAEIFDAVLAATGRVPVVIDADDLVAHPQDVVRAYCDHVGIPFLSGALTWRPGDLDGWQRAAHWHTDVSRSSGFTPPAVPSPADSVFPDPVLAQLLHEHQPAYERLWAHRLETVSWTGIVR